MSKQTFHAKDGRFTSQDSAHTVNKGGERFKVVRQLRRVGGKEAASEPESDTLDTVEEAKARQALAAFLTAPSGWIQLHDVLGAVFDRE